MKYENFTVTQGTRRTISIFYLRGTLKKKVYTAGSTKRWWYT